VFWGATGVAIFVLIWFPVRKFIAWATSYFVVTSDRVAAVVAPSSKAMPA